MAERSKLPRRLSLSSSVEIQRLLRRGHRIDGDLFICVWEKCERFAYGVFVSRKFGTAAKRNRFKRLMREAIRLNRKYLARTVKIGLLPKRDVGNPTFEHVNSETRRAFEKINAAID